MRIAYVTETYPPELNGVALTAARTVRYLRCAGHHVTLVRPRRPGEAIRTDEWFVAGVPIPWYPELRGGLARPARLQRSLAEAAIELVHVATPGPLAWAAVTAARRLDLPVTSDFRTRFDHYSRYYGLGWAEAIVRRYLRRLHNLTHATFVPTSELRDELARQGFQRLQVLGRGVDTNRFAPSMRSDELRARWGAAGVAPVILCAGRVAAEKNVGLALRAYEAASREVPGLRMVVVGDGPARAALERAHPSVVFAGTRLGADLAAHYASADVFLFPSLPDTFGNVVLEALASGLPVVSHAVAAAARHVRDGVSGRLVAPRDEAAFIAACTDLCRARPRSMSHAARAEALEARWDHVLRAFDLSVQATCKAHRAVGGGLALAT